MLLLGRHWKGLNYYDAGDVAATLIAGDLAQLLVGLPVAVADMGVGGGRHRKLGRRVQLRELVEKHGVDMNDRRGVVSVVAIVFVRWSSRNWSAASTQRWLTLAA